MSPEKGCWWWPCNDGRSHVPQGPLLPPRVPMTTPRAAPGGRPRPGGSRRSGNSAVTRHMQAHDGGPLASSSLRFLYRSATFR